MEYFQRRQLRNEDARQYYTDKLRLFVQAYSSARRSLVEFKTNMLMGLYNADFRKTCLTFIPKEIKHDREIKAGLDHQLINLQMIAENNDLNVNNNSCELVPEVQVTDDRREVLDIKDKVREVSNGFNPEVKGSLRPNGHKDLELRE